MRGIGFAVVVLCVAGSLASVPSWSAETGETTAPQGQSSDAPIAVAAEGQQDLPPDEPVAAAPSKAKPEEPSPQPGDEVTSPTSDPQVSSLTTTSESSDNEPVASPKVNLPADLESDGAFRYRIGLSLPAFRGLVPDLGFRYSSSDHSRGKPEAVMGIGWSLAGLSSIERVSEHLGRRAGRRQRTSSGSTGPS